MQTEKQQAYLTLLNELCSTLTALTAIEQEKTQAVQQDDLSALNDCMKREQVLSLSLRGHEQKRQAVLRELGLDGLPLTSLVQHLPQELQPEGRRTAEALQTAYALFRGAFEVAQNTLECNLHQIEKHLEGLGVSTAPTLGYQDAQPDLPSSLRTDFRA